MKTAIIDTPAKERVIAALERYKQTDADLQDYRATSVRLWFQDNGIGIDEELHRRLFHIFSTAHGAVDGSGMRESGKMGSNFSLVAVTRLAVTSVCKETRRTLI
jgi:hypothetical protein